MVDKVIPWSVGDGNLSLSYSGDKDGVITITSDENTLWEDRSMNIIISTTKGSPGKSQTVVLTQKGKTLVAGTTFNFDYTGTVQEVELPKGKYKLQCWGAQGGNSAGHSSGKGSKGGYSEGVLTLTETTTLYVFVGGQGSRSLNYSVANGGWNGGGGSVGYSSWDSGGTYGESYPACGGGATDIALVTSSMSYSNGRTNRSSESLLSRMIVAGGGAGGSYRYTSVTTSSTQTTNVTFANASVTCTNNVNGSYYGMAIYDVSPGEVYFVSSATTSYAQIEVWSNSGQTLFVDGVGTQFTVPSGSVEMRVILWGDYGSTVYATIKQVITEVVEDTSTSYDYSSQAQQGGGVSGCGTYPGTQSAGGSGGGGFGYGANQANTAYRYVSGGGGGGWYGGGAANSDSSANYINRTGGGSGFVNIATNAQYRPTGYTGLQLDSGTTTAGNTSHPSTSGGTEVGHSGNGYARITVIS